MLDRNKRIKTRPERFQNCKDHFDLVITCEERVYDQVLEGEAFIPNVDCTRVFVFLLTHLSVLQLVLHSYCMTQTCNVTEAQD